MKSVRPGLILALVLLIGGGPSPPSHGAAGGNGRILISDGDRVASIRPDGSGYRILLENDDDPTGAKWSPDKARFAYTQLGQEHNNEDLYMRRADGADPTLLATNTGFGFSWSPDGRFVAHTGPGNVIDGTCYGIWVVNVKTLAKRHVTDGPGCDADDPQWSSKGEIVFVDGVDNGAVELELDIYKVDVISGEIIQLTDTPGVDRSPVWAPDGTSIVFESSRDHGSSRGAGNCLRRTEIYKMRSDGSRQRRLTGKLGNPDCNPTWSPDGRHIAWTTSLKKKPGELQRPPELHVMRADGSHGMRLTNGRHLASYGGDFSPDGRWIVFVAYRDETTSGHLYKSRPDGTSRVRLRPRDAYRPADW